MSLTLELPDFENFLKEVMEEKIPVVRLSSSIDNSNSFYPSVIDIYTAQAQGNNCYRFVETTNPDQDKPTMNQESWDQFEKKVKEIRADKEKLLDGIKIKPGIWFA